jgi:hypothetical protein
VRLTDRLPHGLNLRSVEVGRLTCTKGTAVSCSAAQLPQGRSITFLLTAVPTRAGTVINVGAADAGGGAGGVSGEAVVKVRPVPQPIRRPSFTG